MITEVTNLTTMEVDALTDTDGGLNLTDGHARMQLDEVQAAIVSRLPEMFAEASRRGFAEIELEAHRTFLAAIGQHSAPVGTGRILSCYSSTLATDIVARALPAGSMVAILHPTFDNIADLMATRGLRLTPLSEEAVLDQEWPVAPVRTIVLPHPYNPTGLVVPEQHLASLAAHAVRHGQTVIIDASFRGQVRAAQYDSYAVLDAAGADWVIIEDTGKLWPTYELKVGLLAHSAGSRLPIGRAFSESLLSASPVVLRLVTALARYWAAGGCERTQASMARNRTVVRETLVEVGLALADPDSQISVARIVLPADGPDSDQLYRDLLTRGVHVLPCAPFHWADPDTGRRFVRLSLARPYETVAAAARTLARSYAELTAGAAVR